jgi:putative transcriptional regulator
MKEPMKKERPTVAEDLIHGFRELADALEAGGDIGNKFSCYRVQLDLQPQTYTPAMVKKTRGLLEASQAVFATFLGVSVKTVSEWEQGRGEPNPVACRFMDEISRNPDHYRKRLREAAVPKRPQKLMA